MLVNADKARHGGGRRGAGRGWGVSFESVGISPLWSGASVLLALGIALLRALRACAVRRNTTQRSW